MFVCYLCFQRTSFILLGGSGRGEFVFPEINGCKKIAFLYILAGSFKGFVVSPELRSFKLNAVLICFRHQSWKAIYRGQTMHTSCPNCGSRRHAASACFKKPAVDDDEDVPISSRCLDTQLLYFELGTRTVRTSSQKEILHSTRMTWMHLYAKQHTSSCSNLPTPFPAASLPAPVRARERANKLSRHQVSSSEAHA